jgi:hypothetical protein
MTRHSVARSLPRDRTGKGAEQVMSGDQSSGVRMLEDPATNKGTADLVLRTDRLIHG